jgi:hypothetical protein
VISVLVPSFNHDLLERLLTSMEAHQVGSVSRVIVLDNGLDPLKRGPWTAVRYLGVPSNPFVFGQAFNRGVKFAEPEHDIVSMCDDIVMLTDNWLSKIEHLLATWPSDYGMLSLDQTGERQGVKEMLDVQLGPALVIPRWVLNSIGPWDESLVGYGYDDYDYGIRMYHAGFKLGHWGGVQIRNVEQATGWVRRLGSYEAVLKAQDVNFEIFHKKWGSEPPADRLPVRPTRDEHINRQHCTCLRSDYGTQA